MIGNPIDSRTATKAGYGSRTCIPLSEHTMWPRPGGIFCTDRPGTFLVSRPIRGDFVQESCKRSRPIPGENDYFPENQGSPLNPYRRYAILLTWRQVTPTRPRRTSGGTHRRENMRTPTASQNNVKSSLKAIDGGDVAVRLTLIEDGRYRCSYDRLSQHNMHCADWMIATGEGDTVAEAVAEYHRICRRQATANR